MNFCINPPSIETIFKQFSEKYALSEQQVSQFQQYLILLQRYNKVMNLTAVQTDLEIIERHFEDSLALTRCQDMQSFNSIADVGSGAGFPGIPLKIFSPHLQVTLIEVTHKRAAFLEKVIFELGLSSIQVCVQDWRTFLRKSDIGVDCFVSRASLDVSELLRIYKPVSSYQQSLLVYWASKHWMPAADQNRYMLREEYYEIGEIRRRLVFFGNRSIVRT